MKKTFTKHIFAGLLGLTSTGINAQGLLKDIDPGTANSSPAYFQNVNDTLFFFATTAANGKELFKSDGTPEGTKLVKDINPGAGSAIQTPVYVNSQLSMSVNNKLVFWATDGTGYKLWKSDGTEAGTTVITPSYPYNNLTMPAGLSSATPSNYANYNFIKMGNNAYFVGTGTGNGGDNLGWELWKTDGTNAGTTLVKDIFTGSAGMGPNGSNPQNFTVVGNTLYFTATVGINNIQLWKSNGTNAGTVMVKSFSTGSSKVKYQQFSSLANVHDTLYFYVNNFDDYELWKSDGTFGGTVQVKDINASAGSLPATGIAAITAVGNVAFFAANNGTNGTELWKTDGSASGTVMVKDIYPGVQGSAPYALTSLNGKVIFAANNGTNGKELWVSDGTANGTMMIKDFMPFLDGMPANPNFTVVGNLAYFIASNGSGSELWVTDGTPEGTMLAGNRFAGIADQTGQPNYMSNIKNRLFFEAIGNNPTSTVNKGFELYSFDVTPPANLVPAAPTTNSLVASPGTKIDFEWNDNSSNEDGFIVSIYNSRSNTFKYDTVAANTTTYSKVTNDTVPTEYRYSILVFNASGTTLKTKDMYAVSMVNAVAPIGLTATASSDTQINLIWTDKAQSEDYFVIERSLNGTTWELKDSVSANINSYSDINLAPGKYYYRVNAKNYFSASGYTNTAEASVGLTVGLKEISALNVSVFPNPFSGNLNLSFNHAQDATIKIVNLLGATVYSDEINNSMTIDLKNQPAGIYFIHVLAGNKSIIQKLIKE